MKWSIDRFLPPIFSGPFIRFSMVLLPGRARSNRDMDPYFQKKQDVISYAVFGAGAPPSRRVAGPAAEWRWPRTRRHRSPRIRWACRYCVQRRLTMAAGFRTGAGIESVCSTAHPENKVFSFGAWPVSKDIVHDSALISANTTTRRIGMVERQCVCECSRSCDESQAEAGGGEELKTGRRVGSSAFGRKGRADALHAGQPGRGVADCGYAGSVSCGSGR